MTNLFNINTGEGTKGKEAYYTVTQPKNTQDIHASNIVGKSVKFIDEDITGLTYIDCGNVLFLGYDS